MRIVVVLLALVACDTSVGLSTAKRPAPPAIPLAPPADDDIARRIEGIFARVDGLGDVRVEVENGVVELTGETDTLAYEMRATQLAGRVDGVAHVNNHVDQRAARRLFVATSHTLSRAAVTVVRTAPQVLAAVIVLLPFLVLFIMWRRWRPLRVFRMEPRTEAIVRFVLRSSTLLAGMLLAFNVLGIMDIVGTLIGALGVTGVIAGFAFKDWFANYLPRLILGLHPQFEAGDLIQVGDHEGRVVRITPRATVMITINGEELRIPNALLYRQTIVNYSHRRERRLHFTVPLSPAANLGIVEDVGCDALRAVHGVLVDPPPFMRTRQIESEKLEVEYFAWVDQDVDNFRTVESRAKRAVIEALRAADVPRPENAIVVSLRHRRSAPVHHDGHNAEKPERDRKLLDDQLAQRVAELRGK
jgi:small conductance mechanosensitive channel